MKQPIEFTATYGDEIRTVRITDVHGDSVFYQVLVNNYCEGNIFYKDKRWQAFLSARSSLTIDDIQELGEFINQSV